MYRNYLESQGHQIDYIICEAPGRRFSGVEYVIVNTSLAARIKRRLTYYRVGYLDQLRKLLRKDEKYIIQFVDNFQLAGRIHEMLVEKGMRDQCYVQLFYHGFAPFMQSQVTESFYKKIDEVVLLTHDSYKAHKAYYVVFPFRVSVLYNGIDTSKFHTVSPEIKMQLQQELGHAGKKVFLWCSQDRPKKGLSMLLGAWKRVHANYRDTVLLVVGAERKEHQDGVQYIGRVPNDELPRYYQAADCYLFPTLCHEGFGLSLVEALNCGCYCIASEQGGVPEVLQYGKLGKLVENPNFVSEWERAIEEFLSGQVKPIAIDRPLYTMQQWNDGMNRIISAAKDNFSQSAPAKK